MPSRPSVATGMKNLAAKELEREREEEKRHAREQAKLRQQQNNNHRDEVIEDMRHRLNQEQQLITRSQFEVQGRHRPKAHGNMIHKRNAAREHRNRSMHQHDAHPELLLVPRQSGIDLLNKLAAEKHEQLLGKGRLEGAQATSSGAVGPSKMIAHNTVQAALAIEWKGELDDIKKHLDLHKERMRVYKDLLMSENDEGATSVDLLAKEAGLLKRTFGHWFRAVLVQVDARLTSEHRRLLTIVRLNTVHEDDQAPGVEGRDVCLRTIFEWWSLIAKCRSQKPERFRTIRATFVSTGIHAMLGIPVMPQNDPGRHQDSLLRIAGDYVGSPRHERTKSIQEDLSFCDSETTLESYPSFGDSSCSTFHGIHPKDWQPACCRPLSRMRGLNAMLNDARPPEFRKLAGARQTLSRLRKRSKRRRTQLPGLPELSLEQTQRKLDHWQETCEIHAMLARRRSKKTRGPGAGPVYLAAIASRQNLAQPPSTKSLGSAASSPRYRGAASLKAPGEARSPRPAAASFDGPPPRRQ